MRNDTEIQLWKGQDAILSSESAGLTPAQRQLRQMVLDSVTSPLSRRSYGKALDLLFDFAAGRPLTRALLLEYRTSMEDLAPSTINVRLSAIRNLVNEAKRNGWVSADEAAAMTDIPNIRRRVPVLETRSPKSRPGNCSPSPPAPS